MNDKQLGGQPGAINLADIYFVLFRHKWKIIVLGLAGILAAVGFFVFRPPPFASEASLIVELSQKHLPGDNAKPTALTSLGNENHINSEINILFSFDSIKRVVTNIGAAKILAAAGGGKDPTAAAFFVRANLQVDHPKMSSVVHAVFHHPDPVIAQEVLQGVLDEYAKLGKTTHQNSTGVDLVMQEKATATKGRVQRLQDQIKAAQTNSGAIFVEEERKNIAEQITKTQTAVDGYKAELAERMSMYVQMMAVSTNAASANTAGANVAPTNVLAGVEGTNSAAGNATGTNAVAISSLTNKPAAAAVAGAKEASADTEEEYQHIREIIRDLYKKREGELQQFTEESSPVRAVDAQIKQWDERKKKLDAQYPKLASLPLPGTREFMRASSGEPPAGRTAGNRTGNEPFDPPTEAAKIESLRTKIAFYEDVLRRDQAKATNIAAADEIIRDLDSQLKGAQEEYKQYSTYSEQLKLEDQLAAAEGQNPVIESPTPALRDRKGATRAIAMLAVGGLFIGVGWAFLVELFLDRSLKRPKDVEMKLGLPLLLSFPDVGRKGILGALTGRKQPLRLKNGGSGVPAADGTALAEATPEQQIALWDHNHSLHTFYEALRDRLIGYFEVRNLTHKPKLVAVTGAGKGVGTSTIAMGLAASLSETGEGNVLLVDMNLQNGAAHQFFKGRPGCGLDEALVDGTRDTAFVHKNLYVANGTSNAEKLPRILPKRFSSLLPKLKASDYDYIIFDMPPVSQTSITPRLAGFMDMVLMVVESEKTDREAAQRALAMLADSKANVSAVLNKTRKYVPSRLLQET